MWVRGSVRRQNGVHDNVLSLLRLLMMCGQFDLMLMVSARCDLLLLTCCWLRWRDPEKMAARPNVQMAAGGWRGADQGWSRDAVLLSLAVAARRQR